MSDEADGAQAARERTMDIAEVRREEGSRGLRRPYDAAAAERRREQEHWVRVLLAEATEEEFVEAITCRGLRPGSAAFHQALNAFRAVRQSRGQPR